MPSVSIPRRMPTSRPRSPVRVPLGAPNESEQSNKQSTHALLAKTPLDYSSLLFGRRSLPVQVESPTIPVGPGSGLSISFIWFHLVKFSVVSSLSVPPRGDSTPFRLVATLPHSASWRLPACFLLQTLRVPEQGLHTSFGVRISLHHSHTWQDSLGSLVLSPALVRFNHTLRDPLILCLRG
jgi:hypothetical protein